MVASNSALWTRSPLEIITHQFQVSWAVFPHRWCHLWTLNRTSFKFSTELHVTVASLGPRNLQNSTTNLMLRSFGHARRAMSSSSFAGAQNGSARATNYNITALSRWSCVAKPLPGRHLSSWQLRLASADLSSP